MKINLLDHNFVIGIHYKKDKIYIKNYTLLLHYNKHAHFFKCVFRL